MLDFKFEIADFRKIARTLVAFANTDGGRLLIGVKDNGSIAGMRSAEEFYMIEGAARMYCRPEVSFKIKEWDVDRKKVLEVIIEPSAERPHMACDKDDRWMAYIRKGDQNLLANSILLKVWQREKSFKGTMVRFAEPEKKLLEYLESRPSVTVTKFQRIARISRMKAETILVNFIMLKIVEIVFSEKGAVYRLSAGYREDNSERGQVEL